MSGFFLCVAIIVSISYIYIYSTNKGERSITWVSAKCIRFPRHCWQWLNFTPTTMYLTQVELVTASRKHYILKQNWLWLLYAWYKGIQKSVLFDDSHCTAYNVSCWITKQIRELQISQLLIFTRKLQFI